MGILGKLWYVGHDLLVLLEPTPGKEGIWSSSKADVWPTVAIISRVILAMFWFAIQTVNGGDVVQVMITAIWPSFARVHNSIPETEGITTAQMVSFFICKPLQTRTWRQQS